jgi:putative membrane protein
MYHHFDPGWVDRGWWWLGGLVPLLLVLGLGALVVWAVVRLTRVGPATAPAVPPPPAPPTLPRDPALEEVRIRYARGEIDREEFLRRSGDLGGTTTDPTEGAAPESG